jgi:cell division protein FtsL
MRRLTTTLLGTMVVFLLAAMFGIAFFHHRLAEGQYELRDLERRLGDLEYRRSEAQIEVERMSSPQRIADVAALLGMVIPEEVTDLAVPVP